MYGNACGRDHQPAMAVGGCCVTSTRSFSRMERPRGSSAPSATCAKTSERCSWVSDLSHSTPELQRQAHNA